MDLLRHCYREGEDVTNKYGERPQEQNSGHERGLSMLETGGFLLVRVGAQPFVHLTETKALTEAGWKKLKWLFKCVRLFTSIVDHNLTLHIAFLKAPHFNLTLHKTFLCTFILFTENGSLYLSPKKKNWC